MIKARQVFALLVVLARSGVCQDDFGDVAFIGDCGVCATDAKDTIDCIESNGCDMSCIEDYDTVEEFLESDCCPECMDLVNKTGTCFKECLPGCIEDTVVQYTGCYQLKSCADDCKEAVDTAAADDANDFVTQVDGGGYDFDFGELESLSIDNVTCDAIEAQFSEEVCDLANCCPNCIDQFEAVAECLINDVIFGQLLGVDNSTCSVECGDNEDPFGGWPSGNRGRRFLQGDGGGNGNGNGNGNQPPPGDGSFRPGDGNGNGNGNGNQPPPGDGSFRPGDGGFPPQGNMPRRFNLLDECKELMATYIAVGKADKAYQAYTDCFLNGIAKPPPGGSNRNATDDAPTDAPSKAPTQAPQSSAQSYLVVSTLVLNMFMIAPLFAF